MNGWALRQWFRLARLRERRAATFDDVQRERARIVARLAPGKTFADIGGMWGIDGDVAFAAEQAGATDVLLCDGMDPSPEFQRKHRERASRVRYAQCDLHDTVGIEALGVFDIVGCFGVLYHSPNPYLLLDNLRRMTRETLVLSSRIIPEMPGAEGVCLWYPGLSAPSRAALADLHGPDGGGLLGATTPFDYSPSMGYSNCFWGITPSALRSMLDVAGFRVVEEQRSMLLMQVVATPVDRPPITPPVDFARNRDRDRRSASSGDEPWLSPQPADRP